MIINSSKEEKISVDIDDVVAEFMKEYLKFYNEKKGTKFGLKDIINYHLWEMGMYKSKEENVIDVLEFQKSSSFDKICLSEGAKEGVKSLSKKYQIYFITSRPGEVEEKTRAFLNNHFPKNGFNILYSGEIYGGKLSKAEICKASGIPLIIEDNPDYALDCARNGITAFLLDKPWNKNCEKHENIIPVNNWKEILEKLR